MYRQRYPDDPGMHNNADQSFTRGTPAQPSLWDQLRGAACAVAIGSILIVAGIAVLSWNEGRAVTTARSLDEGLSIVAELHNVDVADERLNGHLIHFTGHLHCNQALYDKRHDVAMKVSKLRRIVEMYQWVEEERSEERDVGEGRTESFKSYSYDKRWMPHLVSSRLFDNSVIHENPDSLPMESDIWTADQIGVGTFNLSPHLIASISDEADFYPSFLPPNHPADLRIVGKYFYYGSDDRSPEIGDFRVSYKYSGICGDTKLGSPALVSVMGQQRHTDVGAYQTDAGDSLEMLTTGVKSAKDMIYSAKVSNMMLSWFLRFIGFLINFVGFTALTNIIRTAVGGVPILREIIAVGVITANLCLSTSVSLATIAISWIIFRPVFGMTVLALALLPILIPRLRSRAAPHNPTRGFI